MMNSMKLKISVLKQRARQWRSGFSLIEVTLAIGIIAFALLTVVALLPVGLSANQNARDQAQAAQIVKAIGISIQSAVVKPNTTYTYAALPPYGPGLTAASGAIVLGTWDVPAIASSAAVTPVKQTLAIGEDGTPVDPSKNSNYRFLAAVSITPPKDRLSLGKACIMVAWPGPPLTAQNWIRVTGSGGEPDAYIPQFTKSGVPDKRQGYVENVLYFHAN